MHHLHLGYRDICEMPWEYFEWFYKRHVQHLVDLEEAQKGQEQVTFGR